MLKLRSVVVVVFLWALCGLQSALAVESRVLVTGAAGFVGQHLVSRLLAEGHRVVALDRLRANEWPVLYRQSAMLNLQQAGKLHVYSADLRDAGSALHAARGCATIYHLAAHASVATAEHNKNGDWLRSNLNGTANVAAAAEKNKVQRVVFASSAMVYELTNSPALISETRSVNPANNYGRSKWEGENILRDYAARGSFDLAIARSFNIYGPNQKNTVVPGIIKQLKTNPKKVTLTAPASFSCDFTHVSDAIDAFLLLGSAKHHHQRPKDVFNVCNGEHVPLGNLTLGIAQAMGLKAAPKIEFGQPRAGDVNRLAGDNSRLQSIGWTPKVTLKRGLSSVVQSMNVQ